MSRAKAKGRQEKKEEKMELGYEKYREERIKENVERMKKLGIIDLSLKLKSSSSGYKNNNINAERRRRSNAKPMPMEMEAHHSATAPNANANAAASSSSTTAPAIEIRRRSSRLRNANPVSYADGVSSSNKDENVVQKNTRSRLAFGEGQKEELYTDEHAALLGSCEASWTLFVDGYDTQGRRIYDQVMGKTCHQCRQKTLGHHTRCSKCNIVQGQLCGDCLYMRYGENVLEAEKNLNWICPVCRDICNCSICRVKKGWAPTGALYKTVSRLGFKSVAHYLIQTRRSVKPSGNQIATQIAPSSNALAHRRDAKEDGLDPSHSSFDSKNGSKNPETDEKNKNNNADFHTKSTSLGDTKEAILEENGINSGSLEKSNNEHAIGNLDKTTKELTAAAEGEKQGQDCIAGRLRKRVRSA